MATTDEPIDRHARSARSPSELTATAWKDVAVRVWRGFNHDRVTLIGAGAAFYALLALVPALGAFVAIYGLVFDPTSVVTQVDTLSGLLAPEVRTILADQLQRLTTERAASLGTAFAISLGLSLWSASAGTKAVMDGLNVVYDEEEKRGFLGYNATALVLTAAGLLGVIAMLGVTVVLPVVLSRIFGWSGGGFVQPASYAALLTLVWAGLLAIYRWGPSRDEAEWRWLRPGTFVAAALIIVFSALFSWFARTFAGYASYGSLGAIIAFMTWTWACMVIVLLGAEINAETEHQTAEDSTVGPPRARGQRGATMADTVGEVSGDTAGQRDRRRDFPPAD
ncbi:MAG: YihY/virulence factor BrkB family protein [Hyphomicrobiaceae bacterium]|nr:YihY/virulence factor BrkB family protein [Hyphomicrobiaceae bacterium]